MSIFAKKYRVMANLDLIKFMIVAPLLLSVFIIDYKQQIIPNRLNMTMFEIHDKNLYLCLGFKGDKGRFYAKL